MKNNDNHKIHEFNRARLGALKKIYLSVSAEEQIPLLETISNLMHDSDVGLLLSIAVRKFNVGDDDGAYRFLNKAAKLNPKDQMVLRTSLFFYAALNDSKMTDACSRLLASYPSDEWAQVMWKKIQCNDLTSLSLPAVADDW